MHARSRTVTNISDRLEAPIAASASTATLMAHPNANASAATIRPAALTRSFAPRRLAGMHTPAITTNTIVGIVSAAPLSPPTPSDGGQIPYVPFTPAPTAMPAPASIPTGISRPAASTKKPSTPAKKTPPPSAKKPAEPAIPTGKVSKRVWSAMNVARLKLGFVPLQHALRKKRNAELKAAKKAQQETQPKPQVQPKATTKSAKKKAAKAIVAPRATVGGSPVSSEDERPRMRASMFSPTNGAPMRSESPDDEAAYDAAIQQLNDHMLSPPEHPTATYRYILNRALLLEFRICTPDTLPTSHGAAIAMVKNNIHINVLDYVTKRKEGFGGLRSVMLESAKALRKDVRKRKMPVKQVKSLGLNSLLIARH
ncbi:hypothetical protein FRC09_019789 [Ceratobasidium sp. 395]|nr:hypothetical protein FRC09_019789 [Ceratobasidium sp. 395]